MWQYPKPKLVRKFAVKFKKNVSNRDCISDEG